RHAPESLPDAEVDAPAPRLQLAADEQPRTRIALPAEIEADRTNRGLVAQPRPDCEAPIAQIELHPTALHVAAVAAHHSSEVAAGGRGQLLGEREDRVGTDREAVRAERAHFVAAPPANGRCAAEEIALAERHQRFVGAVRTKIAELKAAGQRNLVADRQIVA